MKIPQLATLFAVILTAGLIHAQAPTDSPIDPVPVLAEEIPSSDNTQLTSPSAPSPEYIPLNPDTIVSPTPPVPSDKTIAANFAPLEQQQQDMKKSEEGYIIKDANLNDIFQFLAKAASRQYFHNTKIAGPDFLVTGHLNDGKPLEQMEELAFQYGLSLHTKGNTVYALTQAQLAQLPSAEFHYQLRYLRPTDMDQIKELIKPMLSPGSGIVNFEPKTNTIIIIDSAHRIEQARELLHSIDKTKGQIVVETKILRVNSNAAERTGVNWATSLGKDGTSLKVAANLNSIFGLPPIAGAGISDASLVLSPIQLTGVLRALAEGVLARQISNPALITEDNEQATISFIDRVPIITTTTTGSTGTANPTVTEEVRYKIDASDPSIDTNPDKHREIGISLVVTPTLLPDGTIRMRIRPRSAQIIEEILSASGNKYPRVSESMIESIARVPDGYSLIIGGFYGETQTKGNTKIPILGDVPFLNFFFKSKEATKEKTSLVFIVTPTSYDPTKRSATEATSNRFRAATAIDCDYNWVNDDNPGPAHEPGMRRSLRGLQPTQAPYYPRTEEYEPEGEIEAPAEKVSPPPTRTTSRPRMNFGRGGK